MFKSTSRPLHVLHGAIACVTALAIVPVFSPAVALAQVPPPPPDTVAAPEPEPEPVPENLTEEQKLERAKGLFIAAEQAFAAGDYATATDKYEQAYYLVPGKHGFAYKVGLAAWNLGDCKKADDYFKHFVKYETDYETKGDNIEEAKRILGEIAVSGCAQQAEPTPAPAPAPAADTGPVVGDEPDLTGSREQREKQAQEEDSELDKKAVSGLMIGGITLTIVGAAGLGLGIGSLAKANGNAKQLTDLSSNNTATGFPAGDFSDDETFKLNSQIDTFNTLSVVGFTVGGVALAAGVSLIALDIVKKKKAGGANASRNGKRVQLTGVAPVLMPGGGGGGASLSF